jgi:acetylcholinesterase
MRSAKNEESSEFFILAHKYIFAIFSFKKPQNMSSSSISIFNSMLEYRYTNWKNPHDTKANLVNVDSLAGDSNFICPVVKLADVYSAAGQDVFMYEFTQLNSASIFPRWMGVLHADEITFVFGNPLYPNSRNTETEKVLTRKMMKYWSNMARYKNPNGIKGLSGINTSTMNQNIDDWPKYIVPAANNQDNQTRLHVNLNGDNGIRVESNLRGDYCPFWNNLVPEFLKNCKLFF